MEKKPCNLYLRAIAVLLCMAVPAFIWNDLTQYIPAFNGNAYVIEVIFLCIDLFAILAVISIFNKSPQARFFVRTAVQALFLPRIVGYTGFIVYFLQNPLQNTWIIGDLRGVIYEFVLVPVIGAYIVLMILLVLEHKSFIKNN